MAKIETLVDDIYDLFRTDKFKPTAEHIEEFGKKLAQHISNRIAEERGKPTLRLSLIGTKCERKLWYLINHPEWAEALSPEAQIKFLYGDILEELLLFLSREAGHSVQGEQDAISINEVVGHRDGIIDGRIVDVKSASTFGFKKFKENGLLYDDPFGYTDQLNSYFKASKNDPLVTDYDNVSFLAIDKQFGHIVLDTYKPKNEDYEAKIEYLKSVVSTNIPPPRSFGAEADGKSGNEKLGTYCSYCQFKQKCWPGLRTFIYSSGPRFLTRVERLPDVPEVVSEKELEDNK